MSIASLAYLVIETGDRDRWAAFMERTVGLARSSFASGEGDYYRLDDAAWRINVRSGDTERLVCAGLECASDSALDAIVARLTAAGAQADEDPALAKERGVFRAVRTSDPCGNAVELVVGRTLGYEHFASPAGVTGFVAGDMGLGHVVLPAPDIEACKPFWLDQIGLGLSDTMSFLLSEEIGPQKLYFMHADNGRHHSVALFESPAPQGIIHLMTEAATIDDVGRFIDRCERDNVHIASQFGRHSNDRMMSVYVVTPGGFMVEFGCDGLRIDWRNWVPTHSLVPDLWGHKFMGGPPEMPAI